MAKSEIYGSLLELWMPPSLEGIPSANASMIPIGFVTTTFTFQSEFFEEHCLQRFLKMETKKESDGAAFLVEQSEKLAGLRGGIVLVDQHHCRGIRSLGWDLVACRIKNGIMHAKITILHWSDCIRLIIGSANLTQPGQCVNQEIYAVMDYYEGSNSDLSLIIEVIDYLHQLIDEQAGNTIRTRYLTLAKGISRNLRNWKILHKQYSADEVRIQLLLISPLAKDGFRRLMNIWDATKSSLPRHAVITSPFFDEHENPSTPSKQIFEIMQKANVEVNYLVTCNAASKWGKKQIINAPEFLRSVTTPGKQLVRFHDVSEEGTNEDNETVQRPLHLKSISLSNGEKDLFVAGSSNFTSAGFGLGKRVNYEANVVYVNSLTRNKKGSKWLRDCELESAEIDNEVLVFLHRPNADEAFELNGYVPLPAYFEEAVMKKKEQSYVLELNFLNNTAEKLQGVEIFYERSRQNIYIIGGAALKENEDRVNIQWAEELLPSFLLVRWNNSNGFAFWPVVVESALILPDVEDLRNLSMEALLTLIGSNQPLYRILESIKRKKHNKVDFYESDKGINVHKLVDTSGFILQRTRRVSYSLNALKVRLEKPVFTQESLRWRLYGPIGVQRLADAIDSEAKNEDERWFLLAELSLELSRVRPQTTAISIKSKDVKAAIKVVVDGISLKLSNRVPSFRSTIADYSLKAIQKASDELSIL